MSCGRNAGSVSCKRTLSDSVGGGINTLPKFPLTIYWLVLYGKYSLSVVGNKQNINSALSRI